MNYSKTDQEILTSLAEMKQLAERLRSIFPDISENIDIACDEIINVIAICDTSNAEGRYHRHMVSRQMMELMAKIETIRGQLEKMAPDPHGGRN